MVGMHIYGHLDTFVFPQVSAGTSDVTAGVIPTLPGGDANNIFAMQAAGLEVVGVGVGVIGGITSGTVVTFTLQATNSAGAVQRSTTVTVTPTTAARTATATVLSSSFRVFPGENLAVLVRTNQSTAVNIVPIVYLKPSMRVAPEQRQTLGTGSV